MPLDIVLLTEARLGFAMTPLISRFDADTLRMAQERRAAGSYRSDAALVDIRTFGGKALEQYRDLASTLLTSGPSAQVRLNDAEATRLFAKASSDLMTLYFAARGRLRETASMTGTEHLVRGLQDELQQCAQACEDQLNTIVFGRLPPACSSPARGASGLLRRLAGRWFATREASRHPTGNQP